VATPGQFLTAADGTSLYVERLPAAGDGPWAILVMIHGFSIHSGFYRDAAAAFARAGLDVTLFDCRGHGKSGGRRGHVRRFVDFREDLHLVIEHACANAPGLPVVLFGHSHGATIALDYVFHDRSRIDALMLATPWLALRLKVALGKRMVARIFDYVWPTFTNSNQLSAKESARDPAVQARLTEDPLVHHVATPRWFNEVLTAQAQIMRQASTLRVPTFMAVASEDRIVSSDAALAFAKAAGPIVETKVYQGAFHELLLEPDWPRIVEDFVSWLVARLRAPYT
jgi:alpha-beta hydrolase superfamily lysophospholipase